MVQFVWAFIVVLALCNVSYSFCVVVREATPNIVIGIALGNS